MLTSSGPDTHRAAEQRPRSRGIRLNDLDREKLYVIGYSGRRWEVFGTVLTTARLGSDAAGPDAAAGSLASEDGAAPGGRHAAPDAGPE